LSLPAAHAPFSVPPIQPHPDKLYVVTVIFSPRRYQARYRLYRTFEKMVADGGAQLLTVEIALGDRPFEVTSAANPWNIQLRTRSDLWHKERALNLGIQRLCQMVPEAKFIAWIDADVTFTRSDWAQETMQLLEHYPVVQMFGEATNLDPKEHAQWTCKSAFREFVETRAISPDFYANGTGGHPGLAWAATRAALDTVGGLMDFCVSGSADTYMANSLRGYWSKGDSNHKTITEFSPQFVNLVRIWAKRAEAFGTNVGYVPGTVFHHWHGNSFQRGHVTRWYAMQRHQFDPHRDIVMETNGLYRFAGNKPQMEMELHASMSGRNEDSIDVFGGRKT
jgi:hypothetical protein